MGQKCTYYSAKIPLGSGGSGMPITTSFDAIKLWHRNKPITSTGYKRPTIVNMSWGYGRTFSGITGGNYRGTDWTGTSKRTKLWNDRKLDRTDTL